MGKTSAGIDVGKHTILPTTNGESPITPLVITTLDQTTTHFFGLSKREYFAGLAMQGMIANGRKNPRIVAEEAARYADKLLRELEIEK